MGCRQSRDQAPARQQAVAAAASAEAAADAAHVDMADGSLEPAPPAPTDPRLPLTPLQVFKLKKSWKGIKRCMESTGVEMFLRLFKANRDLKHLFQSFRHLQTDDELRTNEALESHAALVMGVLDDAISNIDSVDNTLAILLKFGKSHKRIEGFTAELFWSMEKPFLEAVRLTLGDRYTDNMDAIYKITIKFILETMIEGIKS